MSPLTLVSVVPETWLAAVKQPRTLQHVARMVKIAAVTTASGEVLRALERRLGLQFEHAVAPGPGWQERLFDVTAVRRELWLDASDFDDGWDLILAVEARNGPPVRYCVRAELHASEVLTRFVAWMRAEHGKDLLAIRGCRDFAVYRDGERAVRCEYLFASRAALDDYLEHHAPALRRRGRELFRESEVSFTREIEPHWGGYGGS